MTDSPTDRVISEIGIRAAGEQYGVAGLLFTYRCTIKCRHCLFGCAADRPDVFMTPRQVSDGFAMLHDTGRVVHVAGGEAMLFWDELSEGLRVAHAEGRSPHFIETNCSFAENERLVVERMEFLASHGVRGILASADPFHQEMVPPERFLLVRRCAVEIFGKTNFWGPEISDSEAMDLPSIAREPARLRDYVGKHTPVMVGTARRELAQYLGARDPTDAALPRMGWKGPRSGLSCMDQFSARTIWELHLDPYGNIQTNCGIVLGKVPEATPAEVLARGPENANEFTRIVCESGPLGLAELARSKYGFVWPETVSQDCELCFLARRHLRTYHPDVFGPAEIYG
ncbi:MAG: radical SAM protein [Armatimonadetes bacterium]|nr:radical SAM protein [Armatimonadota bacterium]